MVDFDEASLAMLALIVAHLLCRCLANHSTRPNLLLHKHDQGEPEYRGVCCRPSNRSSFLMQECARKLVHHQTVGTACRE